MRIRVQGSFGAKNAPQDDNAFLAEKGQRVPPLRRRWRCGSCSNFVWSRFIQLVQCNSTLFPAPYFIRRPECS